MRIFILFIAYLCPFGVTQAIGDTFQEKFEVGLPTSAFGTETAIELSTGTWRIKGVNGKSDNGSMRAAMSSEAYLITPLLNKPLTVSFSHRGSGNNKVLKIEKSVDNGSTWCAIGEVKTSSASTYGNSSFSVGESGKKGVLMRFTCLSSTIYIDNIEIVMSDLADEPMVSSSLSVSEVEGTTMKLTMLVGDGNGRLLVYKKGSSVDFIPQDGVVYSNLPRNENGNILAYFGNGKEIVISGLEAGETYYFSLFESLGEKDHINYKTESPGICVQTTLALPSISVNNVSLAFGAVKIHTVSKRILKFNAKYMEEGIKNIYVRVEAPFAISKDNVIYGQYLAIPYSGDKLAETELYIAFEPSELIDYHKELVLTGGDVSTKVSLTGMGSSTNAKCYYIAPEGDDVNEGTFDSPWYNLQRAVDVVVPGDTIFCRGGVYFPTMKKNGINTTVRLTGMASADKYITVKNFFGEFPVFNFKDQPKRQGIRGIQLDGNYWHIKGLHITEAGDNGIKLEGSHNIIERCTFSYNDDTGLQLGFGHNFSDSGFGSSNDGLYCAYNDIIDCDSYLNCDSDNFGSDADGFACKMHNGKNNRFIRCRAWDNSDDAWDLYETDFPVYLIECWAWGSGRAELFDWVDASGSFQGNGNGIKMGGNGTGGSSKGKHEAWNCIAFNCNKSGSVKGFDQNSHNGGVKLVNCLAFGCGYDFMFEKSSTDCEFYNNVCMGKVEIKEGATESNNAMLSVSDKAWKNVIRGFSATDYVSLSEEDAKAARGEDGSLPSRFARLKEGSVLIDKGINISTSLYDEFPFLWQPICGVARDLGPYESDATGTVGDQMLLTKKANLSLAATINTVTFSVVERGRIMIDIVSLQGVSLWRIADMIAENDAIYTLPFTSASLNKGIYLVVLTSGNIKKSVKIKL